MALYTTVQPGDWSVAATWDSDPGVGGPGDSDTVVINHAVTIDQDVTIGTSDVEDVNAIDQNADLTLSDGFSLTLRGDHNVADDITFTQGAGCTYKFDSTQSASPTTTQYRCHLGEADSERARFISNGTSGARSTVTSDISGGALPGQFRALLTNHDVGVMRATFTDFSYLGTGGTDGGSEANGAFNRMYPGLVANNENSYWEDCTFDNCGHLYIPGFGGTPDIYWLRCTWTNTVGSNCLNLGAGATNDGHCEDCSFDKKSYISGVWRFERCYLVGRIGGAGGRSTTATNSYMENPDINELTSWPSFTDGVVLLKSPSNPHGFQTTSLSSYTYTGNIFLSLRGTGGDCIATQPGNAGGTTITATGNLTMPLPDGINTVGTLSSSLPTTNITYICEHNTCFVQGVVVGETNEPDAGFIASFKSNFVYGTSGSGTYKLADSGTDTDNPDVVLAADCDYNAGYLLLPGTNGKNYNQLEFSTGTPGDNDVQDINPLFVDPLRTIATYDINGLGNAAGALWGNGVPYSVGAVVSAQTTGAEAVYWGQTINYRCVAAHTSLAGDPALGKPGDPTTTSWETNWEWQTLFRLREDTSRITAMRDWIKEGHAPTATEYATSAHDGTTIGAVQAPTVASSVTATNTAGDSTVNFTWTEVAPP